MRHLTFGDLKLGLRDLLDDRLDELQLSATGRMYEPWLRAKRDDIDAIPDAIGSATPLAAELGEGDTRHDGLGSAVFFYCDAIDNHPTLSADIKAAAARVKATFIPVHQNIRAPYADEAAAAQKNRPALATLHADLTMLATPGGGTLLQWVTDFVDAGDAIDVLLRERARILATQDSAAGTGALRSATIGLLSRMRDALFDELQNTPSLPAKHDASLFSYLDKLHADRVEADRSRAARAGKKGAAGEPKVAEPAVEAAAPAVE